jgi:hypothetical protein
MDKKEIGGLGLSPRSVEQLERVIDTADNILYPAHLMIGGWRLLGAAIVIGIILLCQSFEWLCSSIYRVGVVNTAIALFGELASSRSSQPSSGWFLWSRYFSCSCQ